LEEEEEEEEKRSKIWRYRPSVPYTYREIQSTIYITPQYYALFYFFSNFEAQ